VLPHVGDWAAKFRTKRKHDTGPQELLREDNIKHGCREAHCAERYCLLIISKSLGLTRPLYVISRGTDCAREKRETVMARNDEVKPIGVWHWEPHLPAAKQ